MSSFGEPLLTFVEPTAVGGFEERRVRDEVLRRLDSLLAPVEG